MWYRKPFSMALFGILVLSYMPATVPALVAQSTFDLKPPMQAETNQLLITAKLDPNAIPEFVFAVAEMNPEGKIAIHRALPFQDQKLQKKLVVGEGQETYTETVTQQYTVRVPYTEQIEDKSVTKYRNETRTRTIPVTRVRWKKGKKPKNAKRPEIKHKDQGVRQETIEVPYFVSVPTAKTVDGKSHTVMVKQKRMRTVTVRRGKTTTVSKISINEYTFADLKCFNLMGEKLAADEIKKRLDERTAVVLIKDKRSIDPFFEQLLKPQTMFIVGAALN